MTGRGRFAVLGAIALVLAGALGALGAKTALDLTNTVEFCTSCHEMKDNNYAEYRDTIHASNRTGVRAGCPDCHVPRALQDELLRKLFAVNDLVRDFTGRTARKQHEKLALGERTCIDCHYGIAHREPQGVEPRDAPVRR